MTPDHTHNSPQGTHSTDTAPDTGMQVAYWLLRQAYANLVAAGYATIGADLDREPHPLAYLVDELPHPPQGHPLADNWPPAYPDTYFTDYRFGIDPDRDDPDPDDHGHDDPYGTGAVDGGWC
ncbi:hypothetical protein GCM10009765_59880 [Fodinicola feengrottensis]|uniref:Uncharacterized protein n=1 Tax=Fodinicola feengrottensis TaxID=435914 RepID=A0ABP4UFL5_9ACTN